MTSPKVAVVGIGSIGAMALWQLARRGARVTGYEQFSPGHDRSAHGGETRIFRTAYQEGSDYVPLLQRARQLWEELEQETGTRLLDLCGVLSIGSTSADELANVREGATTYGLNVETLPPDVARRQYPQYAIGDDETVLLDHNGGFLRPELAVLHASRRAEELGATVHRYTTVIAIEPDDAGINVHTDAGKERFDHAIVATGPWAARLLTPLGYRADTIEVRRPVQAWFPARDPELFTPKRCPVFMRVSPVDCYGIPAVDGSGLKLGLSYADNRPVADPDRLDRTVCVDDLAKFRDLASRLLPAVYPDPVRVSAYMEGYTPDQHGIVGPLPSSDTVTLLVGFSGHGFKLAPVFGELGADAVLNTTKTPPIAQLDPARFVDPPR